MGSKEIPKPPSNNQPQLQLPPGMVMSDYQNFNAAGIMGPTSTSQSLSPQQRQQQHHSPQSQPPQTLHQQQQQQQQQMDQIMHLQPPQTLGFGDGSSSSQSTRVGIEQNQSQNQQQQLPRKRGRYTYDSNVAVGLAPTSHLLSAASNSYGGGGDGGVGDSGGGGGGNANSADPPARRRGRPPGSRKKQLAALGGTAGVGFTPHVIEVKIGEDIVSKVMAFWGDGPRSSCILSASGVVSRATLKQASLSIGTVTYEGRYEIITLSGSFLNNEVTGSTNRVGSLCVALAEPQGMMVGGRVVGPLIAATQVQVIVGSFVAAEAKKPIQSSGNNAPASSAANMSSSGSVSQGPSSESSGGNESSSSTIHQQQQPLDPRQIPNLNFWPNRGR